MAKMFKVCCGVREINGEYGYVVKRVRGEEYPLDNNLFIYTQRGVYHLVDKETGLELNHFHYYQDLEEWYASNKSKYEMFKLTEQYRQKVKKFKQLQEVA